MPKNMRRKAHIYHPSHPRIPNTIRTGIVIFDIRLCHPPDRAYIIWPPSSWPTGSKFSDVTKRPIHPAKAIGWKNRS